MGSDFFEHKLIKPNSIELRDYQTNLSDDAKNEKSITAKPGDALIHHGNTIHRAGFNQTQNRHRRGFAMVFKAVSAKRNEKKFKIYDKQSKIQQTTFGIQING